MENKMVIKTVDGVICSGIVCMDVNDFIELKNIESHNGTKLNVPNLNAGANAYYDGIVRFYKDKIIWTCQQ